MKKLLPLILTTLLVACGGDVQAPQATIGQNNDIINVPDLKGCKVFVIDTSNLNNVSYWLYVVKCGDNITTQYNTGGKAHTSVSTTIIDNQTVCVDNQLYSKTGDNLNKLKTDNESGVNC